MADEDIEEAEDDDDDPKAAIVKLILAVQKADEEVVVQDDRLAALEAELAKLKPSALRKRARADGVSEDDLEEAEDSDSPKSTIIELILLMTEAVPAEDSQAAELRAELSKLKPSALRKRARADGVGEDAMEGAEDSDDPKPAIIELILDASPRKDEDDGAEAALRQELQAMKLGALSRRAMAEGVEAQQLDEAEDSEDANVLDSEVMCILTEYACRVNVYTICLGCVYPTKR